MKIKICIVFCLLCVFVQAQQTPLTPFEKKGKYGFQDRSGKVIIDAMFDRKPELCRGGYWIVCKGGKLQTKPRYSYTGGNWAVLDSSGSVTVNFQPNTISEYITDGYFYISGRPPLGLFETETPDGKYGIIDITGKEILPPICDFFKRDGKKEAFAKYGFIHYSINGKYGVVNFNGDEILKPEYDCIGKFKENADPVKAVAVYKNGKCGLFFSTGAFLPPKYDVVYSYNINTKQKIETIVSSKQLNCGFWDNMTLGKFILVVEGNKETVMTTDGLEIDPEAVMNAVTVVGNYIIVSKDNKWGVYSISDKRLIIPYEYQFVEQGKSLSCAVFVAQLNGKFMFIDQNNKPVSSSVFEKQFKPNDTDKYNYNYSWGLCNGTCDLVYFINDDCRMIADKVIKEKRPEPYQNPFAGELNKISEELDNRLKQLKQEKCTCCNGSGKDRETAKTYKTCFKCEGKGYTTWTQREWSSVYGNQYSKQSGKCDRCGGTGKEVDKETTLPCNCCKGSGYK